MKSLLCCTRVVVFFTCLMLLALGQSKTSTHSKSVSEDPPVIHTRTQTVLEPQQQQPQQSGGTKHLEFDFCMIEEVTGATSWLLIASAAATAIGIPLLLLWMALAKRQDSAQVEYLWGLKPLISSKLTTAAKLFRNIQLHTEEPTEALRELKKGMRQFGGSVKPLSTEAITKLGALLINFHLEGKSRATIAKLRDGSVPGEVDTSELRKILVADGFSQFTFCGGEICADEFTKAFLREEFASPLHHPDVVVEGWSTGIEDGNVLVDATPLFMFCLGQNGLEFSSTELEAFSKNFFPENQTPALDPVHVVQRAPSLFEHNVSFEPLTPYDVVLYQACATPVNQSTGCAKKALSLMESLPSTRKAFEDVFPPRLLTCAAAFLVIVALALIDAKFLSFPRTAVHTNFVKEMANVCVKRYMKDPRLLYNETIPVSLFNEMNPECPLALQEVLYLNRKVVNSLSIETSYFRSKKDILQAGTCESFSYVRALYFTVNSTHLFEGDHESEYTIFVEVALDWNVEPQPQYVNEESFIRNDMTTRFAFRYWPHYFSDHLGITVGFLAVPVTVLVLALVSNLFCSHHASFLAFSALPVTLFVTFVYILVSPGPTSLLCCAIVASLSSLWGVVNDVFILKQHDVSSATNIVITLAHFRKLAFGRLRQQSQVEQNPIGNANFSPKVMSSNWNVRIEADEFEFAFRFSAGRPMHRKTICFLGRLFCGDGRFFPDVDELKHWLAALKSAAYDRRLSEYVRDNCFFPRWDGITINIPLYLNDAVDYDTIDTDRELSWILLQLKPVANAAVVVCVNSPESLRDLSLQEKNVICKTLKTVFNLSQCTIEKSEAAACSPHESILEVLRKVGDFNAKMPADKILSIMGAAAPSSAAMFLDSDNVAKSENREWFKQELSPKTTGKEELTSWSQTMEFRRLWKGEDHGGWYKRSTSKNQTTEDNINLFPIQHLSWRGALQAATPKWLSSSTSKESFVTSVFHCLAHCPPLACMLRENANSSAAHTLMHYVHQSTPSPTDGDVSAARSALTANARKLPDFCTTLIELMTKESNVSDAVFGGSVVVYRQWKREDEIRKLCEAAFMPPEQKIWLDEDMNGTRSDVVMKTHTTDTVKEQELLSFLSSFAAPPERKEQKTPSGVDVMMTEERRFHELPAVLVFPSRNFNTYGPLPGERTFESRPQLLDLSPFCTQACRNEYGPGGMTFALTGEVFYTNSKFHARVVTVSGAWKSSVGTNRVYPNSCVLFYTRLPPSTVQGPPNQYPPQNCAPLVPRAERSQLMEEWASEARDQFKKEFNKSFTFPWTGTLLIQRCSFTALSFILAVVCATISVKSFQLTQNPLSTWKDAGGIVFLKQLIDVAVYLAGFIALANVNLMTNVRVMYGVLAGLGLLAVLGAVAMLMTVQSVPTRASFIATIIDVDTSISTFVLLGCIYRCRSAAQKPAVDIEKRLEVAYKLDCSVATVLLKPYNVYNGLIFFLAFTMLTLLSIGLVFYRAVHHELPGPDRPDLNAHFTTGSPLLANVHAFLRGFLTPLLQ